MKLRKKSKKTNTSKAKTKNEITEKATKFNAYVYFSPEEIAEIKAILRIRETLSIPIVIGSTILNKFQILQKILKQGLNVNETGPNNCTALIWAVKYKYLDLVHFLLKNGADPNIQSENGDHVLFTALEHKLWEEESFLNFWNSVNEVSKINVNLTNRTGHSLLHIAVRREWTTFINILLKHKVNVNITNLNDVTPLMTACVRNSTNIINTLISNGADLKNEDHHYRTPLCYIISSSVKNIKVPNILADKIFSEFAKDNSFRDYIKRKIQVLHIITGKDEMPEATAEVIHSFTLYITQYTDIGVKLALEAKIFDHLFKASKKNIDNPTKIKFILSLAKELILYNEQTVSFLPEIQIKLMEQFLSSGLAKVCLEVIKNATENKCCTLAFYILLIFSTSNEIGHNWVKENHADIKPIVDSISEEDLVKFQEDIRLENRLKMVKKKIKKLKRTLATLEVTNADTERASDSSRTSVKSDNDNSDSKTCKKNELIVVSSKKTKRRTKAMKAKLTKIKSMELTERLNLNIKATPETKVKLTDFDKTPTDFTDTLECDSKTDQQSIINTPNNITLSEFFQPERSVFTGIDTKPQYPSSVKEPIQVSEPQYEPNPANFDRTNPLAHSLLNFLKRELDTSNQTHTSTEDRKIGNWKTKISSLPFSDWPDLTETLNCDREKLVEEMEFLRNAENNDENVIGLIGRVAYAANAVTDYLKELLDIIISRCRNEKELEGKLWSETGQRMDLLEKQILSELQHNFNQLTISIQNLACKNVPEALKNIYKLESTLLHFELNGKRLLPELCALENVQIKYAHFPYATDSENSFLTYVQDVLNGFSEMRDDIRIKVMENKKEVKEYLPGLQFIKEINLLGPAKPRNKDKEQEIQQRTLESAYHLIESVENMLESDEEDFSNFSSTENVNIGQNRPQAPTTENVVKILTKPVEEISKDHENSRWLERMKHLHSTEQCRKLLGGDIKIGRPTDKSHIISQGGNFNPVILGLNLNNQPLAVKKIPREHFVCKILKSLINPLLGLRNKNILQYFACDYEENDLILATPLCEYNIGQYVLLLKENNDKTRFSLTQMDIIQQFLNGLSFLHERPEPIVHGNLKPSNIFVDVNGVVRLAEFGISQALYKLTEAPKSSLIWFSQETYQIYKKASIVECTCKSDVQVSGMLVYFILSGGIHPFGSNVTVIMKNLEKNVLTHSQIRDAKNQIFTDLVTWMLMCEPADRPNVKQILSHVMFWSNDRRWKFILNCAGINHHGDPLVLNVSDLHDAIDKMSTQEQIKGHWVNIVRKKFPKIRFRGDDTATGLLKFIRQFYEEKVITEENTSELKNCILTYFPAFPLTLYRILEATRWISHPCFMSYTLVESMI